MSVTHLAGPVVVIADRVIQRCAVCGEKLLDNLNTAAPVQADGTAAEFAVWSERHLVQIDGPCETAIGDFFADAALPEDFCLPLVEY